MGCGNRLANKVVRFIAIGGNLLLRQILALAFIFVCTSIAWIILGATICSRTYGSNEQLQGRVASTWGTSQQQSPPTATYFLNEVENSTTVENGKVVVHSQTVHRQVFLPVEAGLLRAGDDVQHQRGLARRFRPEDFHDAAARNPADAERQVQRERAGRNHVNFDQRPGIAEAHDAAFAVTLGDGGNGGVEFALVRRGGFGFSGRFFGNFWRHNFSFRSPWLLV